MKFLSVLFIVLATVSASQAQIPAGNVCNGGYFSGTQQCADSAGRVYRVVVPPNLPPNAPIFVGLHASALANIYAANGFMSTTGWDLAWATKHGALVLFPEASIDANGKKNWCIDFGVVPCRVDDVAFIRSLVVRYAGIYSTDPKRVFVAGFSMGADMAHKMARDASDLVAAFAAVEGHLWTLPSSMPPPSFPPINPVHELIFCGAKDTILPCKGGPNASRTVTVPDSNWDFFFWVHINGLPDDIAIKPIIAANGSFATTHKIATGAYTVEFYGFPNGGHNWYRPIGGQWPVGSLDQLTVLRADGVYVVNPGYQPDLAKVFPAGSTTADVVYDFFMRHPKP